MANCDSFFQDLHEKIKLDPVRTGQIQKAHIKMRDYLAQVKELKEIFKDTFLQGSYATHTGVKPPPDSDFDVDIVLLLDLSTKEGGLLAPNDVLDLLLAILVRNPEYADKAEKHPKGKCIRIQFTEKFHVDLLPAHCAKGLDDPILVPKHGDWVSSHPKGFIKWCETQSIRSDGKFTRITKYLKWWRNNNFASEASPKSITLTTLVGQIVPKASSDAEALVRTMEGILKFLLANLAKPVISNPSLPSEDLAKDWKSEHYDLFKRAFQIATVKARKAYDEPDEQKSAKLWNELFQGDPEIRLLEEALKKGDVYSKGPSVIIGKPDRETQHAHVVRSKSYRP